MTGTTSSFTFSRCAAEFGGDVGVAHRHPAGQGVAQLLDLQRAAQAALELRGRHRRVLHLQQRAVALLADELAVLLESGQREDALADLDVADGDALRCATRRPSPLRQSAAEDLPIDAELLEQLIVHLPAVGIPIRVDLRVVAALERPTVIGSPSTSASTSLGDAPMLGVRKSGM